jgi:hypothetical protein
MNGQKVPSLKLRIFAVLGLFFLSPFVGEFLLGNLPVTSLWLLPVLALLYGTGCVLIRETAVRLKLRWSRILILCLVYGIFEEAFYTQSLFDPDYLGLRLLDYGYINSLGIGSWWTIFVLGLHVIWSTAVPVALIESLSPKTRNTPFLGTIGYIITAILFLLVCFWPIFSRKENEFMASNMQFAFSIIVVILLIVFALLTGRTKKTIIADNRKVPRPVIVGTVSFFLSSSFMAMTFLMKLIPATLNVAGMILFFVIGCILFRNWSARSDWSAKHSLSITGGLLLTYAWYGFKQVPSIGDITPLIDAIGNIIFSSVAILLFYIAWKKLSNTYNSN